MNITPGGIQRGFRTMRRLAALVGVASVSYEYSRALLPSLYIPSLPNIPKENNHAAERHYRLLKQVCADMDLEPAVTKRKMRLCYSNETKELTSSFSLGSLHVPNILDFSSWLDQPGVVIALPRCTAFTSRDDMEEADVFHDRPVDWDSTLGKRIELSLNMTRDDILKFKMAQHLTYAKYNHYWLLHTSTWTALAYFLVVGCSWFPTWKSLFASGCFGFMMFIGWSYTRQVLWRWLDYRADEEAALVGKEYCRGGILYYFHTVMYNLVLRDIDTDGYTVYDPQGEWIEWGHTSLEGRVERLRLMKQKLEEQEQVANSVDVEDVVEDQDFIEPEVFIETKTEVSIEAQDSKQLGDSIEPKDSGDSQGSVEPGGSVGYKLF